VFVNGRFALIVLKTRLLKPEGQIASGWGRRSTTARLGRTFQVRQVDTQFEEDEELKLPYAARLRPRANDRTMLFDMRFLRFRLSCEALAVLTMSSA
jgi:hypothetical protein